LIIKKCSKQTYKKLSEVDILNVIKYEIPGPVLKAATAPGGLVSILAALMICALLIYVVLSYVYNNATIVRGIGAGFSTTDFSAGYLQMKVELYGYPGVCVAGDPTLKQCDPLVTVSSEGYLNPGSFICEQLGTNCNITWTSPPNNRLQTNSYVTFSIFTSPSSAYAIGWNVSVNSVYPGLYSYVTGFLIPTNQTNVFRGPNTSSAQSIVALSLIPTILTKYNEPDNEQNGLTLDFLSRFPGAQTDAEGYAGGVGDDAFNSQGILVAFELEVPQFVYQKQVLQRSTTISVVSNFVALVGGILGVARSVLLVFWVVGGIKHRIKQAEDKRKSRKMEMVPSTTTIELERI